MHLLDHSKKALAIASVAILIGCKSERAQENTNIFDKNSLPPGEYYVHCETCNWCKGAYKTTQDAQRVCTNHNIQKHDYFKVAYFDAIKCKR